MCQPSQGQLPSFALAMVSFAVLAGCSGSASNGASNLRVQNEGAARPKLIFACDRSTGELETLITPALISELKDLGAGIALSTDDLSTERAQVVKRLNTAGVPMTAWLVLPGEQGYYVNASNAPETIARFQEFDTWTRQNDLRWEAVGLDIEPTLSDFAALAGRKRQLLSLVVHRAFDSGRVMRARTEYAQLIRQMQSRGYFVQTYQFPFMADERKVHGTALERIFGLVNVHGNEEVLMIYTSLSHGSGAIWEYGPDAQTIAVGSTASSGDASTDAKFPPVNWDTFSRDLILARHFSPVLGVYSLEGCVRQGFMLRLETMDWNQPVFLPQTSIEKATRFRRGVRTVLWVASHVFYFAAAFLLAVAWLLNVIVRRWKRKRAMRAAAVTNLP